MPDRLSPKPDPLRPQGAGHYRADDDIELPPLAEVGPSSYHVDQQVPAGPPLKESARVMPAIGGIALVGALLFGGWLYLGGGSAEKQHENWRHVAAAAQASTDTAQQLVRLDSGNSVETENLELSTADMNGISMQQIRTALLRSDLISATAALQAAQRLPSPSSDPEVRLPTIDSDVTKAAILEGRNELYQIELFDCCDEDGDIVEVVVNGNSFAVVPIMHQGAMVSIPLSQGSNTVTVRAVKDGTGGVTVSFRTSRGEYFARPLSVGEEHRMEVIVQ